MATSSDELEDIDLVEKDDYYAWLGLSRGASLSEVNNAFRKMSRIYHPDKHVSEEMKEKAEALFTKIKKAHEVLIDPHKRAIYDTTGIKGLETEGWEIVPRTKTPQEILEEFERLQRTREEQRLEQRTNPKGTLSVGINATDIFDRYADQYLEQRVLPVVEMSEMSITQSVECPLTTKDTAVLSGGMSSRNGTGSGSISLTVRRILSHAGWAELEMGLGESFNVALRGFRTLWLRGYGTMSGSLRVSSSGIIRPGANVSRLSYNWGNQSFVNTILVWNNEKHRVALVGQLGVPSCFTSLNYSYKITEHDLKLKGTFRIGTMGVLVEYGCDKKITQFSYLGASLVVGVPLGVSLKIRLSRGQQTFLFPIQLSETICPTAIVYGSFVPVAVYFVIKRLIVDQYVRGQKERDLQLKKEANAQRMAEKRRDAATAIDLMRETVDRSYQSEESKGGLCIRKALYGKLQGDAGNLECINVTIPLQALVKDSKLILFDTTELSQLQGFYDPCVGEEKELSITYEFRKTLHTCLFKEKQKILLPSPEHRIDRQSSTASTYASNPSNEDNSFEVLSTSTSQSS